MSLGVSVLVASYNRPTMLAQAIRSIVGARQIVVMDDGSTFDVRDVVSLETDIPVKYVLNPQISIEERMERHYPGVLYNRAIFEASQPIITYLCDDDLFAPGWIPAVSAFFESHPGEHIVRGDWLVYGTDRDAFDQPDFEWVLTTGNFAYLTSCADGPENCLWSETTVGVHDGVMLAKFLARHRLEAHGHDVLHAGVLAGWRRQHAYNMIHFVDPGDPIGRYRSGAKHVLGGLLE